MKNNPLRRGLTLLLTLALLLGLAAPALAEEEQGPGKMDNARQTEREAAGEGGGAEAGGEEEPGGVQAKLEGIAIVLDPAELKLQMGEKEAGTIRASIRTQPEGIDLKNGDYAIQWAPWQIEDDTVARMTETGDGSAVEIEALRYGATTISVQATVTDGEGKLYSDTVECSLAVRAVPAESLSLVPAEIKLDVGKAQSVTAAVSPSGADPTNVTWEMRTESVAKVTPAQGETVTVEGVAPGDTTLTARSGEKVTATCRVVVAGVAISDSSLSLISGNSQMLTAQTYGDIGTGLVWTSSREDVATVGNDGRVTARNVGSSTITVQVNGTDYTASCEVTVRENTAGRLDIEADAGQPVYFSELASEINRECRSVLGDGLYYVTGLSVPTADGILYYGYSSAEDPGAGVGTSERYYYTGRGAGERDLDQVVFVPSIDFTGTTTDISYTGFTVDGRFFKGTIRVEIEKASSVTYSTSGGSTVRFDAADFNKICRERNGRDLDYVTFSPPPSSRGTLYYRYSGGILDTKVSDETRYYRSGSPSLSDITFVPAEGYSGTVSIQYRGQDARGNSYSGRVTITVAGGGSSSSDSGEISYSTSRGRAVTFDDGDFNDYCREVTGDRLNYVRFDLPSSSKGTLYYNYTSSGNYDSKVSASRTYYRSGSPYLERISFVPASGYTGTVEIDFTGWSDEGDRFVGTVTIRVEGGSSDGITYRTSKNRAVTFDTDDFNSLCRDETGDRLDYVRFDLPASSKGTLYYNYTSSGSYDSRVSASTNYYRNKSSYLDRVSFVPASGYTGTVEIDFTGRSEDGERFTGTVTIQVTASGDEGEITYRTGQEEAVGFDADDFNDLCRDETGDRLDYVRFDLPASSKGTLYYNYTNSGSYDSRVSASTNYYRNKSSYLDRVSFVPASGHTGTVEIDFTGWSDDGERFSGTVTIRVDRAGARGDIRYSTSRNRAVAFDTGDFNDLCRDETGDSLDYVRFDLPTSSKGTLYYNYTSSSNSGNRVSASTNYYRNKSSYLDRVSFVPADGYSGTVEVNFTAWSTAGERFHGTVTIQVSGTADYTDKISYQALSGGSVRFNVDDFNRVSRDYDGQNLNYVLFDLPASSQGTLYYNYDNNRDRGEKVSGGTRYYRDGSPYLDQVSFVPSASFSGTAQIPFTAYDKGGSKFTGTVEITVTRPIATTVSYTAAAGQSTVNFLGGDFNTACRSLLGNDLDWVVFTPPASSQGTLYFGYTSASQPGSQVSGITSYYFSRTPEISQVTFLPAAGFSGTVTIPYTAQDTAGNGFSGTVAVTVPAAATQPPEESSTFGDLAGYEWAAGSIAYLSAAGVIQGTGDGNFVPHGLTSRGDFTLMLVRAYQFPLSANSSGFTDVPADSYYAKAIATGRELGIVQGNGSRFNPTSPISRQDAMVMLQRAMRASGRAVPDGAFSDLARFADGGRVANYAVGAVAAMVNLGIVQGDGAGRLNLESRISRAEIAVILHRTLTL